MHLQFKNISKSFPGVKALQAVDFEVLPGEIHALCGENGAGKSTLMNVLAGNLAPEEGTIYLDGKKTSIENSKKSFDLGISIVYQHLSLIDTLSVAENVYANNHPVNRWGIIQYKKLFRDTTELLERSGLREIDPRILVSQLSPAEKQMVEIAKALARNPSILILDEPTASLAERETKTLYSTLENLKRNHVSTIYISHRLEEVFHLADRITILKDGRVQGTFPAHDISREELIRRMVGRDIQKLKTVSSRRHDIALSVHDLTGKGFKNISFDIHRGEILGLAGLIGAGRTEIARAIFGADGFVSGEVRMSGKNLQIHHAGDALEHGIAYVPEERKTLGLFPEMTIEENIVVAASDRIARHGFFDSAMSLHSAQEMKERLKINSPDLKTKAGSLSGGNQQKVLLAKWLVTDPTVLIIDEPTHGIDIGARFEIYSILQSLTAIGKGVLMISSDLPELLGICDRIIVIRNGSIAGELSSEQATEEKVMELAAN